MASEAPPFWKLQLTSAVSCPFLRAEQDRNNLVREVIRYMLFSNPRTKDAPVLKTELNGIVTKVSKARI